MTKNKHLAPCPFCGSDQFKISPNMSSGLLRVQCEGCWATSITSNQRATIIAAWNRRTDPVRDELVAALRKICEPITVAGDIETVSACQDLHEIICEIAQGAIAKAGG